MGMTKFQIILKSRMLTAAQNISLPDIFPDIPVTRRSRRKVPDTVTTPTAETTKTADIGQV